MPHQTNETLRKSIHIAIGLLAFTLKWLPWWLAALVAGFAVLGNFMVLHRIVGTRVARHERGWDAGIVLYPAAVLLLILVFRNHLSLAAAAFTTLAFGDGLATIVGRRWPIASLPWNGQKSWGGLIAFLVAGSAAGLAVSWWLGGVTVHAVLHGVLAGAIVESLDLHVNDNVTVPFAAAVAIAVTSLPLVAYVPWPRTYIWLIIHTILALAGWAIRSVDVSGLIGGWILGAIILLGAGWPLYLTLLAFFVIGTLATRVGYSRKARQGLAQEKEGRRGFSHAFSNAGVAAICAIAVGRLGHHVAAIVPLFMAMASLATAAADTAGSEIGPLVGRRPFLPLSFRRVPPGTEGAVSIEGTLIGIVAAGIVAMAGTTAASVLWPVAFRTRTIVLVTACAFLGSYLESIAGSWNQRTGSQVPNGVLNFFNTVAGAILLYYAWPIAI